MDKNVMLTIQNRVKIQKKLFQSKHHTLFTRRGIYTPTINTSKNDKFVIFFCYLLTFIL